MNMNGITSKSRCSRNCPEGGGCNWEWALLYTITTRDREILEHLVMGEVSPYNETPSITMCPRDEGIPAVRK